MLRVRYLSLREIKKQKIFHLVPDFFLVICSYSSDESWRIVGEKAWHTCPVGKLVLFRPGIPLQFLQSPGCDRHGMMLQIARGEIWGMDHFFVPGKDFIEFNDTNDQFSSLIRSIAMMLVGARLRHISTTQWGTRQYMDTDKLYKTGVSYGETGNMNFIKSGNGGNGNP